MIIYPAIDIRDGKCVRLLQGQFDKQTIYCENPEDMAKRFIDDGAQFIHTVDLDGAQKGAGANDVAIAKIVIAAKDVPVQLGGGIRTLDDIKRVLSLGVSRVIIGTKAVEDRVFLQSAIDMFPDKIVVGIDAKGGYASTHGWCNVSSIKAVDLALDMKKMGVKIIIYTDIDTDGMLTGPNLNAQKEMMDITNLEIIASGGVSVIDDIVALKKIGAKGVITGKAIYEGVLDLKEAIEKGRE